MTEERDTLVAYWLQRAREAITETEMMVEAGHWNTCVSRLYYACFYAATALLQHHGQVSAKHSGVLSLFNRQFVKTGIIPRQLGAVYNELFTSRQRADYRPLIFLDEQQVRPWMSDVTQLVERVGQLVTPSPGAVADA